MHSFLRHGVYMYVTVNLRNQWFREMSSKGCGWVRVSVTWRCWCWCVTELSTCGRLAVWRQNYLLVNHCFLEIPILTNYIILQNVLVCELLILKILFVNKYSSWKCCIVHVKVRWTDFDMQYANWRVIRQAFFVVRTQYFDIFTLKTLQNTIFGYI